MLKSAKQIVFSNVVQEFSGASDAKHGTAHLSFITPDHIVNRLFTRNGAHPNVLEYKCILQGLQNRFKKILVTDYRYQGRKLSAEFAIGFGAGINASDAANTKVIYYATGSSYSFQTMAVAGEYSYILNSYSSAIKKYFRIPEDFAGCEELGAKWMYCIGNQFTANTFQRSSTSMSLLPGIALGAGLKSLLGIKDSMANDLLWVGSKGVLHKGLHIAADVARMCRKRLHVVGVCPAEFEFSEEVLKRSGCIYTNYGFVSIDSTLWDDIIRRVVIVLGCSVSEGMSTSLLTAAKYGAIPISTDTCGINEGLVVPFNPRSTLTNRLSNSVMAIDSLNTEQKFSMSCSIIGSIDSNNTINSFYRAIDDSLALQLTEL